MCLDGRIMSDFLRFLRNAFDILKVVRAPLAALLVLMLVGAGLLSIAEGMDYWSALYLTLITGLTVGYGDIAPATVLGRIVSLMIGFVGLVLFGIVIAVANRAVAKTVKDKQQEKNGR